MSSGDLLHMFGDYMDSLDQLRLIRMMMIMRMILKVIIMVVRVSADAAQLLATKFSNPSCGRGHTYAVGHLTQLF